MTEYRRRLFAKHPSGANALDLLVELLGESACLEMHERVQTGELTVEEVGEWIDRALADRPDATHLEDQLIAALAEAANRPTAKEDT